MRLTFLLFALLFTASTAHADVEYRGHFTHAADSSAITTTYLLRVDGVPGEIDLGKLEQVDGEYRFTVMIPIGALPEVSGTVRARSGTEIRGITSEPSNVDLLPVPEPVRVIGEGAALWALAVVRRRQRNG